MDQEILEAVLKIENNFTTIKIVLFLILLEK